MTTKDKSPAPPVLDAHPADAAAPQDGVRLIAAERQRQMTAEGWTTEHDDTHGDAEMTAAACCYAALARRQADGTIRTRAENIGSPSGWPWEPAWWKPSDDPIRNLVKAGALIAAEIGRLQRLTPVPDAHPADKS
jgi:hypothetical protein